jgi:hypothetical protein
VPGQLTHARNVHLRTELAEWKAHEHALASYARCAGIERAARFLRLDERELRRLVKEVAR